MRRVLTLILIGIQTVSAQDSFLSYQGQLGLFNSSFSSETLFNSDAYWDDQDKQNILAQLGNENHIYFLVENQLKYGNKKNWSLALNQKSLASFSYPIDLLELGLYGNASYLGQELSFAPFQANFYLYSEIELGFKIHSNFFLTSSLIAGHQFASFKAHKATFFTAENGGSIEYELDLEGHYTNFEGSNLLAVNGIGAALGLYYEQELDQQLLQLSISDIGFVVWDESTTNLYINANYQFEGINVENLLDFNEDIIQDELDSIEQPFNASAKESYNWKIPALFKVNYQQKIDFFMNAFSVGAEHRFGIYTDPFLYANLHHNREKTKWSIGYHTGGLERNSLQFSFSLKGKKTEFQLYTRQANAFISDQLYGIHLGFGVKKTFSTKKTDDQSPTKDTSQ